MLRYVAVVKSCETIDGDSQRLVLDLGYTVSVAIHTRVVNVDCPEKNTQAGQAVKALVDRWLQEELKTEQLMWASGSWDMFGRSLGDYCDRSGVWLSGLLLANGLAKPYNGKGARAPWTQEELEQCLIQAQSLAKIVTGEGS